MSRTLITNLADYQSAIDQILALAERELLIFDHSLAELALESLPRHGQLERLLGEGQHHLQIIVRDSAHLLGRMPRLLELLRVHAHHFSALECAPSLSHLTDAMIIADGCHGLIRFHQDQPRSKLLIDEPGEIGPYLHRFQEIVGEGGTPLNATTLGL